MILVYLVSEINIRKVDIASGNNNSYHLFFEISILF
jgi:hypothetical protein